MAIAPKSKDILHPTPLQRSEQDLLETKMVSAEEEGEEHVRNEQQ